MTFRFAAEYENKAKVELMDQIQTNKEGIFSKKFNRNPFCLSHCLGSVWIIYLYKC